VEIGAGIPWVDRKMTEVLDHLRERLDPAAFERAWERGKRMTPDAAVAMALAARSEISSVRTKP
jgi:hypothetical protein